MLACNKLYSPSSIKRKIFQIKSSIDILAFNIAMWIILICDERTSLIFIDGLLYPQMNAMSCTLPTFTVFEIFKQPIRYLLYRMYPFLNYIHYNYIRQKKNSMPLKKRNRNLCHRIISLIQPLEDIK